MQNNLTVAGVLRAKKFVVDDLPTGIEEVEITESAVSGGNNVITITYTNGESQTFIVKNGEAGKTAGAFGFASSTASQSTWDTAKNYLVPTTTEGEFNVYTYEDGAWYQVDTFQVDIAGTADAVEYDDTTTQLDADNVQEAIEALNDKTYPIDDALDETSELPVQNKVVTEAFKSVQMPDIEEYSSTLSVPSQAMFRIILPFNFVVGETYNIEVSTANAISQSLSFYVYQSGQYSNNTNKYLGVIPAGGTTAKTIYTPVSETNYQFFGFWNNNAATSVDVTIAKKQATNKVVSDTQDAVESLQLEEIFNDCLPNLKVLDYEIYNTGNLSIRDCVVDGSNKWYKTAASQGQNAKHVVVPVTNDSIVIMRGNCDVMQFWLNSSYDPNTTYNSGTAAPIVGSRQFIGGTDAVLYTPTNAAYFAISVVFGDYTKSRIPDEIIVIKNYKNLQDVEINLSSVLPYYQRVLSSGQWARLTNRYGRFLPVEVGDEYKITASNLGTCVYGVLADNYCDVNTTPNYAEGYSAMASIPANDTREVTINAANAKYLYIETSATGTTGRPPAKVIKTNGVIRDDVNANTKDIAKINNELFTQEKFDIAYADVTASLPTSYMTVTRNGKEITMTVTQTLSAHRVILNSPTYNLVSGVRYRITFDINNQTGKTAYIRWANNTDPATGAFGSIPNGYNGSKSYEFVWGQGTSSTFSFSVGNAAAGATLVINNISIVNVTPTENIKTNETDIAALDVRVTHLEVGDTPQATTKSEYVGDVFPYPKKHYIGSTKLAAGGASNWKQGADQYNGYVFQFDDFNRSRFSVFIYDLSQPAFLTTVTPTRLSTFHQGAHCNEVCFSRKFYDAEDTFPLLYVSSGASAIYNYAQVYRIQQSGNTFTITQVQEIAFPATIGGITVQWMQIYVDNERNAIWQTYETGGKYRFARYAIPATTEENVTLTESNILETFDAEKGSNQQGGVIYKNKLYLAVGSSTDANPPAIDVFDLSAKCKIVRGFNLRALGVFTGELESVFFYEDNMYGIGQSLSGVYRFYFGG
jgi:hypothetical protein